MFIQYHEINIVKNIINLPKEQDEIKTLVLFRLGYLLFIIKYTLNILHLLRNHKHMIMVVLRCSCVQLIYFLLLIFF